MESLFAGRYRILARLGGGGAAEVHEALDLAAGDRRVALKIAARGDSAAAASLLTEFRVLRRLHAAAIPRALDFGSAQGRAFLSRAIVGGEPLDIRRRPWRQLAPLARLLLQAVRHLHARRLVHGDLKAANVLSDAEKVALIDLGLAAETGVRRDGSGTPGHIAPEVLAGAAVTEASDLFALGVLFRRCLEPPIPAHVREALDRARREDPGERFADVEAFWNALRGTEDLEPLGDDTASPDLGLVGRDDSLTEIVAALEQAGAAVVVTGSAGVGKTRLLREVGWSLQARGIRFAATSARDGLGALRAAVGLGALRAQEEASASAVAVRIALALGDEPAVLCVDDLHEASGAVADVVRALRGLLSKDRPLALVVADRDGASIGPARRWDIGPLGDGDADRLLSSAGVADSKHRADLRALCAGSPGALVDAARGFSGHAADVARSRLAMLPAGARRDVLALAFARGSLPVAALSHADGLEADGLVDPAGAGRVRLANTWMGEALLDAEGSTAATAALDALRDARLEPGDRLVLAQARLALGDPDADDAILEAAEALLEVDPAAAARVAADRLSPGARRSPRALAVRIRGGLAVGDVRAAAEAAREPGAPPLAASAALLRAGDDVAAAAALEAALAGPDEPVVRLERARLASRRGRIDESLAEADAGLAIAGASPETRVGLLLARGLALGGLGRDDEAIRQAEAAAEIARSAGDARGIARAQNHRAIALQRLGRRVEALDAHHRAAEAAEQAGLATEGALGTYVLNVGAALYYLRRLEDAERETLRALWLARLAGRAATESSARLNLASIFAERGQTERALEEIARVLDAEADRPQGVVAAAARVIEGDALRASGALEDADRRYAEAEAIHREAGRTREAVEASLRRVALALDGMRLEVAARLLAAVDEAGLGDQAASLALQRGRLARLQGDDPTPQLEPLATCEQPEVRWEAEHERGLYRTAKGEPDAARAHHERAARILEEIAGQLPADVAERFWKVGRRAQVRAAAGKDEIVKTGVAQTREHGWDGERERLHRLLSLNARIAAEHDVDRLLEAAMDTAVDVLQAERGFLLVRNGDALEVRVARNIDREAIQGAQLKWSRNIAEEVFRTREILITTDAMADDRLAGAQSVHAMRLRSILCVPVVAAERAEGVLYLDNRFRTGAFAEDDVRMARALADQLAVALVNARLILELRTRTAELEAARAEVEALLGVERARGEEREGVLRDVSRRLDDARRDIEGRYARTEIVGRSAAMRKVFDRIDRVLDSDVTVLLTGESGTGKELVARAIHGLGSRKDGPFVAVNCGAIPEALLESELFGHVRGAFTGAVAAKGGLFVAAHEGTLLLDEVSDMPPAMQVKLLRVLQDGKVRPVGGTNDRQVDVRVLAATQRPLEDLVQRGGFREDLFYRLRVVGIEIPPLRDRPEDIPAIADRLLGRIAKARGKKLRVSDDALRALVSYAWPGNVRELGNVLERAAVLVRGTTIEPSDLGLPEGPPQSDAATASRPPGRSGRRDHLDAKEIRAALEKERGHRGRAAKKLGVSRVTLYRRMRDLGID